MELVTAARGLDLRAPLRAAPGTGAALARLRETVPGPGDGSDRWVAPELAAAEGLIACGDLVNAVQSAIGELR